MSESLMSLRPMPLRLQRRYESLFPALPGHPVHFDNAAMTRMPIKVIQRLAELQSFMHYNPHSDSYADALRVRADYEDVRTIVANFIGAPNPNCIILTTGTTAGMNLVAHTFVLDRALQNPGKTTVVYAESSHHAGIAPWHLMRDRHLVEEVMWPMRDDGLLYLEDLEALLTQHSDIVLVSIPHVSNVIATVNDVKAIAEVAHRHGAKLLVDGAQAAPHMPINMTEYGCDFYAFSGVKTMGPEGTGALYVAPEFHEQLHPFDGGGDMMYGLEVDSIHYKEFPQRFEPGTRNYGGTIAFGRAIQFLQEVGMERIQAEVYAIGVYAYRRLHEVPGIAFLPPNPEDGTSDGSLIPFTFYHQRKNVTNAAVGQALGALGIRLREGCLCAQLTTMHFGWDGQEGVIRPSFSPLYNGYEDVDRMVTALQRIVPRLARSLPMPPEPVA